MSSSHLLVIEDDLDVVSILQGELQDAGYQVSSAGSVVQGLIQAREISPDLIITDLGLPDGDGRDIVSRLRCNRRMPIIVFTARDDVAEKVALLDLGASDYLVKPVSPRELLARVAVQLRVPGSDVLTAGPLELSPGLQRASLGGEDLGLSHTELELLGVLMRQPGRVYSRQDLVRQVWNGQLAPESNVIDVHISNLREKCRQRGGYSLIRTVRGLGYALRLPVH
jgi:two-component system, OmpR family, copper resistance phosphate regulon response regulator CusR